MRYLVTARLKVGQEAALQAAIDNKSLGLGSVAGDEYFRNMESARLYEDGTARWVEVCFCRVPLDEERAYWEEYFEILSIKDAHARKNCKHENGQDYWACTECDCTIRLEAHLAEQGTRFLALLKPSE